MACSPMRARSSASSSSFLSAAVVPEMSPLATSSPFCPDLTISAGPRGQSMLTMGVPWLIASTSTIGNPSARDVIRKISALASTLRKSLW